MTDDVVDAWGWDTETHPIKPGLLAPRKVCTSWATFRDQPVDEAVRKLTPGRRARAIVDALEPRTGLVLRDEGLDWLEERLRALDLVVVHNAPYDFGVAVAERPELMPLVFAAYDAGRVWCTLTRQKLIDVATGMRKFRRVGERVTRSTYGLADLVLLYSGRELQKGADTWQLRYAEIEDVPVEDWDPEARDYAIKDAVEALRIRLWQIEAEEEISGDALPNGDEQMRADWALHLMSMWGVRADQRAVDRFVASCEEKIAEMREQLLDRCVRCDRLRADHVGGACAKHEPSGILKPDGSRTMAEIRRRVVESLTRVGLAVPMTDPSARFPDGQVQTDQETLEATDDPYLHLLADNMTFAKHLGQWGPVCRAAVLRPVCARYNVLVDNGRTSCSGSEGQDGTNFQNPPRKGDVRPCFVPRPGWLYCSTDADTIELRGNAQNCWEMFGESRMREVLWQQHDGGGLDLHSTFAAAILDIPISVAVELLAQGDEAFANARQLAKHVNFAFAGGAGPRRFVAMAKGFGIDLAPPIPGLKETAEERYERAVERATELRDLWLETWPEERLYFDEISRMIDRRTGRGTVRQLMSGRIRADVNFTAAANTFFSGRVADAMKEILFRLAHECYVGTVYGSSARSPLYGSRPVMFLHDEPILEHPERDAHERAERQQEVMVEGLSKWMPDVPTTSSAVLSRRWYKGAKPLRAGGRLVAVRPVETEVGGKKKVAWVEDLGEDMAA